MVCIDPIVLSKSDSGVFNKLSILLQQHNVLCNICCFYTFNYRMDQKKLIFNCRMLFAWIISDPFVTRKPTRLDRSSFFSPYVDFRVYHPGHI